MTNFPLHLKNHQALKTFIILMNKQLKAKIPMPFLKWMKV